MTPTLAHIAGIPVEEGVLLVPAGAAVASVVVLRANAKLAEIVAWRRRR